MDTTKTTAWIVVQTHAHKEHVAIEHLNRQMFETYCPKIIKRVRRARRFLDVERPIFPGYVFVKVCPERAQWRPILSTIGVRNLVRCGDKLSPIADDFILGLKARERDGVVVAPERPYKPGERIKLAGGPFDGVIATILSVSESDRLVVLMGLFQNQVRATLHANQVRPAPLSSRLT